MGKMNKIKVLVVDDSFVMRKLLSDILEDDPEISVIGTAKDGSEALQKIPESQKPLLSLSLSTQN